MKNLSLLNDRILGKINTTELKALTLRIVEKYTSKTDKSEVFPGNVAVLTMFHIWKDSPLAIEKALKFWVFIVGPLFEKMLSNDGL